MGFPLSVLLALAASAQAYWLMGADFITTERIDPVVSPGKISSHVHSVVGGSNFRFSTSTASLRQSDCTSVPIPEDKSNYWFPHLYFQWANGNFTNANGGAVIYYLFNDKAGTTKAFPDDFRMLSGDPNLRTYDPNSYAQQAVTFLCLDFNGVTTRHNSLPEKSCPSGVRAQINFPSCWDGKNLDSSDHKSHVAFLSGGPDSGTCTDPNFPVTLPRIFIEVYWATNDFEQMRSQAMNPSQPFVFSNGDPTGYGYHADYINGWDAGVLQKAVDNCHCNIYGDPSCCADQGIFHLKQGQHCHITKSINEATTGTLSKLPGNNPVQPEGRQATTFADNTNPQLISPVYAYTGDQPTQTGTIVGGGSPPTSSVPAPPTSSSASVAPSSTIVVPSSPAPSTSATPTSTVQASPTSTVNVPPPSTTVRPTTTSTGITFPTFSFPSVSIPTISFPHINNVAGSSPTSTAGNSGAAAKPGTSTSAVAASSPTPVASSSSGGGKGGHGSSCPAKHKRAKRAKHAKRSLFAEDLEIREFRERADLPAAHTGVDAGLHAVDDSIHRSPVGRRFRNHHTN